MDIVSEANFAEIEVLQAVDAWSATTHAESESLPDAVDQLRRMGVLAAVLPRGLGGSGLGTEPAGAEGLFTLLRLIGRGSLSLGRIVEGHVNAVQLILRYGNRDQATTTARDVQAGHLHAIWNTEMPPGVRSAGSLLTGRKSHCSAAGVATRGLITVDQDRLLVARLTPGDRTGPLPGVLHGMRATRSGWVDFEAYAPAADDWIGQPGDYMREPVFSAGAWRTMAVILGGMDALVTQVGGQLRARRRDADPHQRARVAELLIAQETVRLWIEGCARRADRSDYTEAGVAEYVNLARRTVEASCLNALQLTQRCIGLAGFVDSNPIEQLMRDLATYLRQPAMDEGLEEAAAYFMTTPG